MLRILIILLLNHSLHLAFVNSSHAGVKTSQIDSQQVMHLNSGSTLTNRQKPVVLWRRMGAASTRAAAPPVVQTNQASNIHPSYLGMNGSSIKPKVGSDQSQAKRVLRRRRIKTVLPVGLSSWILGGIRDLDGRHWHLPADVMNRLAVNDIDLHHEVPISSNQPPGSGSIEILSGEDNNNQPTAYSPPASIGSSSSTGSASSTPKPATRSNQLVPR